MWQGVLASLAVLSGQHIIIFAIFYGIYLAIINNKFIKKIDRGNALQLTIYLFFISVITISILHYFQDKIQLIKLLKFMALSWLLWILRKANSFYQWNANNTYITFGLILVFILFENLSSGYFHKWFYTNILINSEYNWKSYYYDSALILSSLFIWPVILTCWHHKKQSYYMGAIVAMLFITLIYSSADAALMAFGIGLLVAFIIYKIPYTDYLYYYGFFSFILLLLAAIYYIEPEKWQQYLMLSNGASAMHRVYIWKLYLTKIIMFLKASGIGNGVIHNPQQFVDWPLYHAPPAHAHNHLLQLTYEVGIIPSLILLFFYHLIIKNMIKIPDKFYKSICFAAFSTHFIIAIIYSNFWLKWQLIGHFLLLIIIAHYSFYLSSDKKIVNTIK